MVNYSPSASRWVDGYFALGYEWDRQTVDEITSTKSHFVTESGIKFRVNIHHTPFRFLARLGTGFWGFRVGVQTRGTWSFSNIGYVVEFGAGSW